MPAYLEVRRPSGVELVALDGQRATIGKDPTNAVALGDDETVSRLHAVVEDYGAGWTLRDLGSANGTFVNGERVLTEQVLRPGDQVRVGATQLVFRDRAAANAGRSSSTVRGEPPPELTRREADVLLALCRPLATSEPFRQPASVGEIARELVVTEAAVKQHLGRLYDKFGIGEDIENRRLHLANAAIRRGALGPGDLGL